VAVLKKNPLNQAPLWVILGLPRQPVAIASVTWTVA
jgi:hypothetical protein